MALVRNESIARNSRGRGRGGLLDIEQADAAAFGRAFDGCDAVVFAAGGGPDGNMERKRTVDLEGSLKSIEGARLAGIRRFVQVSAIDVDARCRRTAGEVWQAYVEAKRDADAALRGSDLDWTILRPGRLTDDAPTGLVALGPDVARARCRAPTSPPSWPRCWTARRRSVSSGPRQRRSVSRRRSRPGFRLIRRLSYSPVRNEKTRWVASRATSSS